MSLLLVPTHPPRLAARRLTDLSSAAGHVIAIHRWGRQFTLHPDGTTSAISPDGKRVLHSRPPPERAA